MINKSQILSLTSNFPNVQGLKAIPTSLLLLILVVWSDQQTGNTRDLALPLLICFGMGLFYWFVDQYYKLSYGRVKQTAQKRTFDVLLSIVAGGSALAAFIADSLEILPISLLGLVWAASLVFDGIRTMRSLPGKVFPFFWISAAVLGLISILPALGLEEGWFIFGIQHRLSAVWISASLITMISGVLWHSFLTRNLVIDG